MKTKTIYYLIGLGITSTLLLSACNSSRRLDKNLITQDSITNYIVFEDNHKKATGVIESKYKATGIKDSVTVRFVVKEGVLQEQTVFYANGNIFQNYYIDSQKTNHIYQREDFTPDGKLEYLFEFDSINRLTQSTQYLGGDTTFIRLYDYENNNIIGTIYKSNYPIVEVLMDLNLKVKKTYYFDENGDRITPAIDQLEVLACKTGFYRMWDKTEWEYKYYPIVILKMKNITDHDLHGEITVVCSFFMNGEDIGTEGVYFQRESDKELASGIARQVYIIGPVNGDITAAKTAHITCHISINGNSYKEVEIANEILLTNRIQ